MFHMMNEARISVGLGAAALAYTGYLHALEYARTRCQGRPRGARGAAAPVPIVQHPDVRRMLLAQKAYASGALALCLYAARLSDDIHSLDDARQRHEVELLLDLLTPVVKSWPSQWGLAANDLSIQVHGGYGYSREYNVEQFYRDNRLNAIHEGTFGIQALDLLGRKTRLENGAGMTLLGTRIGITVDSAAKSRRLAQHAAVLTERWRRTTGEKTFLIYTLLKPQPANALINLRLPSIAEQAPLTEGKSRSLTKRGNSLTMCACGILSSRARRPGC